MREGLENFAFRGSYQRLVQWVEAFVPSARSEERSVTLASSIQGQIERQLPELQTGTRALTVHSSQLRGVHGIMGHGFRVKDRAFGGGWVEAA